MSNLADQDKKFLAVAYEEAQAGYREGGVPIGAALVGADGNLLGRGHNMRVQKGSATLHVSCLQPFLSLWGGGNPGSSIGRVHDG